MTFTPKAVIYPAAGKDEILVVGDVSGEIRNAPLIHDPELAARFRMAAAARGDAIKAANTTYDAERVLLEKEAMNIAVMRYNEASESSEE